MQCYSIHTLTEGLSNPLLHQHHVKVIRGQNKSKFFKGHLGGLYFFFFIFRARFDFSSIFYTWGIEMSQHCQGPFWPLALTFWGHHQLLRATGPKGLPYFDHWRWYLNHYQLIKSNFKAPSEEIWNLIGSILTHQERASPYIKGVMISYFTALL